jgi:hypothetical protein
LSEKDMKWFYSTKFSRNVCAHYCIHNKTTTTASMTMVDTIVSEASASGFSSTSSAFIHRMNHPMNHCMNSTPSIFEPLGGIPDVGGEQQEEEINLDISIPAAAEDDSDGGSSAITSIIHNEAPYTAIAWLVGIIVYINFI